MKNDTTTNSNRTSDSVDNSALLKSYKTFQSIMRGGILACIVLGFVYLIALNSIATRGFDLEKIKEDRLEITKELEQIEIDLAIPLSLYALQSSTDIQDMAIVEEKQYLFVQNGRVQKDQKVAMGQRE